MSRLLPPLPKIICTRYSLTKNTEQNKLTIQGSVILLISNIRILLLITLFENGNNSQLTWKLTLDNCSYEIIYGIYFIEISVFM